MEIIVSHPTPSITPDMPWGELVLLPIGDVQYGAEACWVRGFKEQIQWGLAHNAYYLGMGDYVDVASPSNRRKLKEAGLYDSVHDSLEEKAEQHIEEFLRLVKGTEGRWLGLLEGHHYYEFRDGSTSDTRLAFALGAPFLGDCAMLRVPFKRNTRKTLSATIWCHHGEGSGTKASAPLNKIENIVPGFNADLYLMGHHHKKVTAPIDEIYLSDRNPPHLIHKTKQMAATGSYLRSYLEGSHNGLRAAGTYAEQRMYRPVTLGGVIVRITPVHREQEDYLKITVEQ